jgi:hypothetical protein
MIWESAGETGAITRPVQATTIPMKRSRNVFDIVSLPRPLVAKAPSPMKPLAGAGVLGVTLDLSWEFHGGVAAPDAEAE